MRTITRTYDEPDERDIDAFNAMKRYPPVMAHKYAGMSRKEYRKRITDVSEHYALPPPGMSKKDHAKMAICAYERQTRKDEMSYRNELKALASGALPHEFVRRFMAQERLAVKYLKPPSREWEILNAYLGHPAELKL